MRRTFTLSSVVVLSLTLAACGSQPSTTVSPTQTQNSNMLEGLVFDEQAGQRLFTAQDNAEGSLDYRLYLKDSQGQVQPVALPSGKLLVIGATFAPDRQGAYAMLRFDTPQGSNDALYALSFSDTAPRELYRLENSEVSGTLLNSLRLQGNALQFTADHLIREAGQRHPESDAFQLKVATGVSSLSSNDLSILSKSSAQAADYAQFLKTLNARDLAAQRVMSQNISAQAVTGYLSWPKASSGHNTRGSYLHSNADAYALDINRGSVDADLGDDVLAARSGDVIQRSSYTGIGYGNYLVIRHGNYTTTHYAHLSAMHVNQNDYVTTQQYIGDVGKTGLDPNDSQQSAHLHFAFRSSSGGALPIASTTYPMNAKLSGGTCGVTTDMHDGNEYYRC